MLSVYRAERRKLLAQLSTRALALVCALGPFAFGAILSRQSAVPADTLLGVWVHSSGYAVSFVVLGFGGYLAFPVLAGVLAGDLFSCEDRYGTWKTVLTRSRSRGDLFAGKALAAGTLALALLALAALSSLLSGLLLTGDQPLVGLGGNVISSGEGLWLVLASWLLNIPPLLAFTSLALLFSVATRNGIVGVLGPVLVGLVMQLLELIGSGSWVHTLLVASAFNDWHGLLGAPKFYGPMIIGNCVSVLWIATCLGGVMADPAQAGLRRRAGHPQSRVGAAGSRGARLGGADRRTRGRHEPGACGGHTSSTRGVDLIRLQQAHGASAGGARSPGHERGQSSISTRSAPGTRARAEGPGDDWTCTMTVITAAAGVRTVPDHLRHLRREREIRRLLQGRRTAFVRRPADDVGRARAQRRKPALHDLRLFSHDRRARQMRGRLEL